MLPPIHPRRARARANSSTQIRPSGYSSSNAKQKQSKLRRKASAYLSFRACVMCISKSVCKRKENRGQGSREVIVCDGFGFCQILCKRSIIIPPYVIFIRGFRQSRSCFVQGGANLTQSICLQSLDGRVGVRKIDKAVKHPVQRIEHLVVALAVADAPAYHAVAWQAMLGSYGSSCGKELVVELVRWRHKGLVHMR